MATKHPLLHSTSLWCLFPDQLEQFKLKCFKNYPPNVRLNVVDTHLHNFAIKN